MNNVTETDEWEPTIEAVQLTNIIITVICAWLLASSIFWGSRDGRWMRKPAKSSFNSGVVFVTYIVTTAVLLARIVLSLVHMNLSADGSDSRSCRIVLEATSVTGYCVSYGTYLFVWIQQRRIFLHPCVKEQVSGLIKALSILFFVACTLTFAILISWHFIDPTGLYGVYTCYINTSGSMLFTVATTTATCVVHLLMLSLSLYPAFQENIQTASTHLDDEQPQVGAMESSDPNSPSMSCFVTFYKNIKLSRKMKTSPINVTIRRVVYGTCIIFLSDLVSGIATLAISPEAPSGVRKLPQNIGDLVGVLGMLVILGFLGKFVTFFIPIRSVHIQKVARRTTKSVRRTVRHKPVSTPAGT